MVVFMAFSAFGRCITAALSPGRSSTSTSTPAPLSPYDGGMAMPKAPGWTGGTLAALSTALPRL